MNASQSIAELFEQEFGDKPELPPIPKSEFKPLPRPVHQFVKELGGEALAESLAGDSQLVMFMTDAYLEGNHADLGAMLAKVFDGYRRELGDI